MTTCERPWCKEETPVPISSATALTHRAVVTTIPIAGDEVNVVLAAVDDGPASVIIETREQGSTATRIATSTNGADTAALAAALLNAIDLAHLPTSSEDPVCDVDATRAALRALAAAEQHTHGPEIWTGPFDITPFGLAHAVTGGFLVSPGSSERAATWLLSTLTAHSVETGHIDRETAREIAEVLGPDVVQVIGGWIHRAEPTTTPATS